jgi:Ca2+-binding EF-hand superfamily protein
MKADSVRAIFNAFDADGNGTLDKAEVLNALRMWDKSAKITPEDIDVMWPSFDTNRDGVIDYEEFSNLVLRQLRQDQASNMLYSD